MLRYDSVYNDAHKSWGDQAQTSTDTDYEMQGHSLLQGPLPLDYDSTSFLIADEINNKLQYIDAQVKGFWQKLHRTSTLWNPWGSEINGGDVSASCQHCPGSLCN